MVLQLCRSCDVNGDGAICEEDLTKALDSASCAEARDLASVSLASAAADGAGKVSLEAFSAWLQGAGVEQARLHDYLVQAVFAYGTLRGDFSKDGDRWGVINEFGGRWQLGKAKGFQLYQNTGLFYPFAVQTGDGSDTLVGTVLQFPDAATANMAVRRCNSIEGFDAEDPTSGLYRRALVEVRLADSSSSVLALVYHQIMPEEGDRTDVKHFASGDWFEGGGPPKEPESKCNQS